MTQPIFKTIALVAGGILLLAILAWQAFTSAGSSAPTSHSISKATAIVDTGYLSTVKASKAYWSSPLLLQVCSEHKKSTGNPSLQELDYNVQAATGLLAILVLLVVMNWFFHKIYWTGWIAHQNRKKKELIHFIETADNRETIQTVAYIRMQVGSMTVFTGTLIAAVLIAITGYLTFIAHKKLPYNKMLVFTGLMLGIVFEIMVGEQVNEMQLTHWIPTHYIPINIPAWAETWFSVFNNWENILAQIIAAIFIIGSYFLARMGMFKARGQRQGMH